MFRGSVKGTGYPLHSPVSPSLPLHASPCAITFQLESNSIFFSNFRKLRWSRGRGKEREEIAIGSALSEMSYFIPKSTFVQRGWGGGDKPHALTSERSAFFSFNFRCSFHKCLLDAHCVCVELLMVLFLIIGVPRGGWSVQPPPKFRRPSKTVPNTTRFVKTVKNCWI